MVQARLFKNEKIFPFFISLSFIFLALLLPLYDEINGWHNLILDNYNLTWYDGRSPVNFYLIKNLVEGKPLYFQKGFMLGFIPVEEHFDFYKAGEVYKFGSTLIYLYPFLSLTLFPSLSELSLFKLLLLINTTLFALILFIFYFIQRFLGLEKKYAALSTFIGGIATAILIYSRYLFLRETLFSFLFMLLIYMLFQNWKRKTERKELLISVIFSAFILVSKFIVASIFFVLLLLLVQKFKLVRSIPLFAFSGLISLLALYLSTSLYLATDFLSLLSMQREGLSVTITQPFFNIFPQYIPAIDYKVYGFHNMSSERKLDRFFSYIYGFEEGKGNALFLFTSGLFGVLFSERGFVYNSPFLVFSVFGILCYKRCKERDFLLVLILTFLVIFGLLNFAWHGGLTPRYVRNFDVPILFLTFFSFSYLQKGRSKLFKALFFFLLVLSILNVFSLAMRADWVYMHPTTLFSYDLVLWPFI